MSEKIFTKGIYYNKPRKEAPSYVLGSLSIKLDDFISFAGEHVNDKGYINVNILDPKDTTKKPYMTLDTYVKPADEAESLPVATDEDIPF